MDDGGTTREKFGTVLVIVNDFTALFTVDVNMHTLSSHVISLRHDIRMHPGVDADVNRVMLFVGSCAHS